MHPQVGKIYRYLASHDHLRSDTNSNAGIYRGDVVTVIEVYEDSFFAATNELSVRVLFKGELFTLYCNGSWAKWTDSFEAV